MRCKASGFLRFVCLISTLMIALAAATARGQEPNRGIRSGPLCGVYSLYTALRTEGFRLEFSDLLKPQYVGSSSGSTLLQLLRAARENDAQAELLTNLSVADLHQLGCPVILHVKNEYDSPEYNHFILCVPLADGRLALYDPPEPLVRSTGHELAPLWDGTALAISSRPVSLARMRLWAALRVMIVVLAGLMMVGCLRLVRVRWIQHSWAGPRRLHPIIQFSLLVLSGSCMGAAYHLWAPEGFGAQHDAVNAISNSYFLQPPGWLDWAEARRLWATGARFVDARSPDDYQQAHIEGAMNLPPDATRSDRTLALAGLAKEAPVVVYCQSPACPYAALLAKRLARDGFRNVWVFPGGWAQWSESPDRSMKVSPPF